MSRRLSEVGSTAAVGEHRIGDLPDDLLAYLMSFLPSRDSVRTSVLARRWRSLWRSVPALRLEDDTRGDGGPRSKFVDELLRRRHPTPLNVCDICSDYDTFHCEEAFTRIKPWLRYAFSHDVRALRVVAGSLTTNLVLVSSHLKRVELCFMQFKGSVNFTGCRVLDVLEMKGCNILASILCQSVRHLTIKGGCFDDKIRRRISAPNLISLKLAPSQGLTPLLDSMPSLLTASVESFDQQYHYCFDVPCEGCDRQARFPVVLEGLSAATNLELTTDDELSIFRMDLKWCPMFSKLKCLLLNKWCVADYFTGLVYFLQHSPILETLTLLLDFQTHEKWHVMETYGIYDPKEQSPLSKHLKVVKIIRSSTKEDVIVDHILKILCAHGVPSEQIDIQ
ncbi:putative F-box/LRR-repeat protein At5g02930 [Aegilops tauschii subsp. strangulata]|uniref:F-box domain-containing protein n=1 Tax=Aegilops tauschii subsp. strangulata TaxID=200361 RepID=A0A453PZ74_AEGTS|nr:putative F-box/LRR-repeat protein At5g02930 [Aegilops tauschii subsp. strangulata]XP_040248967.1 putative F-box/LRR-repeat protein At5g02930 [Aegilops tauschii subsp. strangulata]